MQKYNIGAQRYAKIPEHLKEKLKELNLGYHVGGTTYSPETVYLNYFKSRLLELKINQALRGKYQSACRKFSTSSSSYVTQFCKTTDMIMNRLARCS